MIEHLVIGFLLGVIATVIGGGLYGRHVTKRKAKERQEAMHQFNALMGKALESAAPRADEAKNPVTRMGRRSH